MPGLISAEDKARKRKRNEDLPFAGMHSKRSPMCNPGDQENYQSEILQLEKRVLGSRRHYNSIADLLELAREPHGNAGRQQSAVVALCRIFCRLMAVGSLSSTGSEAQSETVIVRWLRERYADYRAIVLNLLGNDDLERQSVALTLSMQLVKEEASNLKPDENRLWESGIFAGVVRNLATTGPDDRARERFMRDFVEEYDDIRFYTFTVLA